MDFESVLRMLAGFFEETSVKWGVVGGLAMAVYGAGRTTLDVDIVVDGDAQTMLVDFLEARGYETLHRSTGYSNHLHHDPLMGRVDVVYVGRDEPRSLPGPRSNLDRPGPDPGARPEHVAAMKAFAIKNDRRRTCEDIRALLDAPGVDRAEINSYMVRYGLEALLERLDEADSRCLDLERDLPTTVRTFEFFGS